ncbi:hypothetical protein [Fibrobacter intestinalis]|nr:hypothetical protein [Fibrobacter intestinalis]
MAAAQNSFSKNRLLCLDWLGNRFLTHRSVSRDFSSPKQFLKEA